jgi:excisionase family DNA binding protein
VASDPLDLDALADALADRVTARLAPVDDRPLLSQREVADRLGVSTRTVRDIVARGELRFVMVTEGAPRYVPRTVDAFVAARQSAGTMRTKSVGACPVCSKRITRRSDGTLRLHGPMWERCRGSYTRVDALDDEPQP